MKFISQISFLSFSIQLICALVMVLSAGAASPQMWVKPVYAAKPSRYVPPPLPKDRGAPGNRGGAGAASRNCREKGSEPNIGTSVIALVPTEITPERLDQGETTHVWGLTAAEYPTFWFYVPYTQSSLRSIEFVLKAKIEQSHKTVYRTKIELPQRPGIVSVQLPSTIVPLEIGQQYNWFFKVRVICPSDQSLYKDYVEGWVQRVSLDSDLEERITKAKAQQRSVLYAENGIWYDALTTLAESRLLAPKDASLGAAWTELLKAVGLEDLAKQPLMQCCNSVKSL